MSSAVGGRVTKYEDERNQRIENREIKLIIWALISKKLTSSVLVKEGVREHGRDGGWF